MEMVRSFRRHSALTSLALAGGVGTLVYLAWRFGGGKRGNRAVPEPAKSVDLSRYLGVWYELGRYKNRFERGCEGVTAEYAKRADGLIDVVNTCHECDMLGRPRIAKGRARVVKSSRNSKLKVSFFGPLFFGNYWVLDHADDYAWSIVGEPSGRYLWILSRDPAPPDGVYLQLIQHCRSLGYDMSKFRRTLQSPT